MLEAKLIKEYQPPYNVLEKDDKSFLCVEVTAEPFQRILLVRGKSLTNGRRYGPFLDARNVRAALKMLRKIFPYATHPTPDWVLQRGKRPEGARPCFDYQIGLCPGTCLGTVSRADYRKNIRRLELIFKGKKSRVIRKLEIDMQRASKTLEFERAAEIRRQLFGIKHIQDIALISDESKILQQELRVRIEGYDISNISGTSAVGSMVVFEGGEPNTSLYRKFRIRTVRKSDDIAMLEEVLRRRFKRMPENGGWPLPCLILIDGGLGQVNAARRVVGETGCVIPIVGIAKGPNRKKNEFVGSIPSGFSEKLLIRVRDEAHRFAIQYHRQVRSLYK
jgi:excinuclease ABC subunit C